MERYKQLANAAAPPAPEPSSSKKKKNRWNKHEYDSDEDTEGGTWEHKKRREEMEKTAGRFLRAVLFVFMLLISI